MNEQQDRSLSSRRNPGQLKEVRSLFAALIVSLVIVLTACNESGGGDVVQLPSGSSGEPPAPEVATKASIVVTADTPPEISNDQRCSLIEAIINANTDAGTHSDCAAGNGADVIVLPASSTQLLTVADNSIYGPTGLPVITSTITIEGNGSTIVRDTGVISFRILAVAKGAELRLHKTNISGGDSQRYGDVFAKWRSGIRRSITGWRSAQLWHARRY